MVEAAFPEGDYWKRSLAGLAAASEAAGGSNPRLTSGAAWSDFCSRLQDAAAVILDPERPLDAAERADGFRYLMGLLTMALTRALRFPGLAISGFQRTTDDVLRHGLENPDCHYYEAYVSDRATYRVVGTRGSPRYLGFQVNTPSQPVGSYNIDDFRIRADGSFELVFGGGERAGNWIPLPSGADRILARQFFYDWEAEVPASFTIEPIEPAATIPMSHQRADPDRIARQLMAAADYVCNASAYWKEFVEYHRDRAGVNRIPEPETLTRRGLGNPHQAHSHGYFRLGPDEALVVEVTPPDCLYWSVHLGNFWFQGLENGYHHSSLNGHQARRDPDGMFRGVVAHRDPGIANWLDTLGNPEGIVSFRWLHAENPPTPSTKVVSFGDVQRVLADSPRMGTAERAEVIRRRRRARDRWFAELPYDTRWMTR